MIKNYIQLKTINIRVHFFIKKFFHKFQVYSIFLNIVHLSLTMFNLQFRENFAQFILNYLQNLKMIGQQQFLWTYLLLSIIFSTSIASIFNSFDMQNQYQFDVTAKVYTNKGGVQGQTQNTTTAIVVMNKHEIEINLNPLDLYSFKKTQNIVGFQFFQHTYQMVNENGEKLILSYEASRGLKINIKLEIPNKQITIQGQSYIHTFQLPIITLILLFIVCMILPLNREGMAHMKTEMAYHTNIVSLLMVVMLNWIMLEYIIFICIWYLYNGMTFLNMVIIYITFLSILSIFLVHFVNVFKVFAVMLFKKLPDDNTMRATCSIILVISLILFPIMLSLLPKGQYFLYFTTIMIVLQVGHSIILKDFPYIPFFLYAAVCIITLMFLQASYPIMNFIPLSKGEIRNIMVLLVAEIALGLGLIKWKIPKKEISERIIEQATVGVTTQPNIHGTEMANPAKKIYSMQQTDQTS